MSNHAKYVVQNQYVISLQVCCIVIVWYVVYMDMLTYFVMC